MNHHYAPLKAKHHRLRDGFPQPLSLRVHRALSWLERAEREGIAFFIRYIPLWDNQTMILDTLPQVDRYLALHPLFAHAFEFLRNTDLLALAPGKHTVQGEEVFAIVEACAARTRAEAKLECHRRYIDIQLVLEGVDEMGWKPVAECVSPKTDYNAARDIRFFNDAPSSWVATPAGSFCIFFPEDAHAPLVGEGMIRKVVMKIAVSG